MTDLRELFEAASTDAPTTTRIDPYAAVRASRRRRTRRHRWLAGGVTAALVLGVAGAVVVPRLRTPQPLTAGPAAPTAAAYSTEVDCSRQGDVPDMVGHLPVDFGTITAAYLCDGVERKVPGDGVWQYVITRAVTGDLSALQQVLEQPDSQLTDGPCTANVNLGPPIWVVGAKRSALVRVPVDGCGHAVASAVDLVRRLPTRKVSEQRLRQAESQVAVDSGCSQDFKDMLRQDATADRRAGPSTAVPRLDDQLPWTVCRYDVAGTGMNADGGSLVSAKRLSGAEVAKVNRALALSRPDGACRAGDHSRFAILTDGQSNYWIDVALDGCAVQDHPINQGSYWWRAADSLRRLLSP